jgi:hypothetical protein
LAFLTQITVSFIKNLIINNKFDQTLVCEKNANFFVENWQKSVKFVVVTSTPGKISVIFNLFAHDNDKNVKHSFVDIQITDWQNVNIQIIDRQNVDIQITIRKKFT